MTKTIFFSRKPTQEDLDLSGLGMQVGSMTIEDLCHGAKERVAKIAAERSEFIAKYGRKEGLRKWLEYTNPPKDYDEDLKDINEGIYNGSPVFMMGTGGHATEFSERQIAHMRLIYGSDFDRLYYHPCGTPEVVERLLKWADETGHWKELPDVLQSEYHAQHESGDGT